MMAKVRDANSSSTKQRKTRPGITPEARENQMISYAIDLAEEQLRNGTASSQVITHFLKLATAKEKLEREKLEQEVLLTKAKTKALEEQKEYKELVADALKAMRNYSGQGDPDEY